MNEIWKDIPGYEGVYQASTLGRLKRLATTKRKEKILKLTLQDNRSTHCSLANQKNERIHYQVHRLIALTFIPNPENKPEINHINGIRSDNRICNLEWVTRSENMLHAWREDLKTKENKTSQYRYVHYKVKYHLWCVDLENYNLYKSFKTEKEAVEYANCFLDSKQDYLRDRNIWVGETVSSIAYTFNTEIQIEKLRELNLLGNTYSNKELKNLLKTLYDKHSIVKTPKAITLKEFYNISYSTKNNIVMWTFLNEL